MSKAKYVFGLDVVFLANNFWTLFFALGAGLKSLTLRLLPKLLCT